MAIVETYRVLVEDRIVFFRDDEVVRLLDDREPVSTRRTFLIRMREFESMDIRPAIGSVLDITIERMDETVEEPVWWSNQFRLIGVSLVSWPSPAPDVAPTLVLEEGADQ